VQQWHMSKERFQSLLRQSELCRKVETRVEFKVPAVVSAQLPFLFLGGSVFHREDGGNMLLRNVGSVSLTYTPLCPTCLRSLEHICWFHEFIL
jgi:hypothetical protein